MKRDTVRHATAYAIAGALTFVAHGHARAEGAATATEAAATKPAATTMQPIGLAADRLLRAEVTVPASQADVWNAWTTEEGIKSFFAPGCHMEPRVDGPYEIYFNPSGPPGMRGGDDLRVLAFEPPHRLAFTWNAPPALPHARGQRTMVVVEIEQAGASASRVRLTHLGWGAGPDWDQAFAYFDRAWRVQVLPFLRHRFEKGPIDWKQPPEVEPVGKSMAFDLAPRAVELNAKAAAPGGVTAK